MDGRKRMYMLNMYCTYEYTSACISILAIASKTEQESTENNQLSNYSLRTRGQGCNGRGRRIRAVRYLRRNVYPRKHPDRRCSFVKCEAAERLLVHKRQREYRREEVAEHGKRNAKSATRCKSKSACADTRVHGTCVLIYCV